MSLLASGLEDVIGDSESLARFITSSGHFAKTTGRVKYPAFLPDKTDHETSVFRVNALDESQISKVGSDNVPNGHFHGAAIVLARVAREAHLEVAADEPPHRHGVFRNWPKDDDPIAQKSARMSIAEEIAEDAFFSPRV